MPLTHRTLTIAGWLTMMSAFASIPMAYLAFTLEGRSDAGSTFVLSVMQGAGTALFVVITLFLKRFLNRLFMFHDSDKSIVLMILANVVAGFLIVGGMYISSTKEIAGIAALVLMVFQGIVQIRFGYTLLKLGNDLGGLLKPFSYLNIATGICVASIVLILAGVVVSAIADLMLATLFFNASKQLKEAGQKM